MREFIRKALLFTIIVISFGGIVCSLFAIFQNIYGYHQSAKRYEEVEKVYTEAGFQSSQSAQMLQINSDYVGWITIEDTNVQYPVVKAENNSFYLSHNFYREKDFAGSIFMDYRNSGDKLDRHIILYGHNMKDGSMFGQLKNYLQQDFYEAHMSIRFNYRGSTYEWEIFSVYTSEDTEWMETQFHSDEQFEAYIAAVTNKSVILAQAEATSGDTILTLSTCTNRVEEERFIVHAKLMKKEND